MSERNAKPRICVVGVAAPATRYAIEHLEDTFIVTHERPDRLTKGAARASYEGFIVESTHVDDTAARVRNLVLEFGPTPVIALTDTHDAGAESAALAAGAADCMALTSAPALLGVRLRAHIDACRFRQEREQRFQSLVESSIQGIAIHRAGRLLFANQAFATIHGYASPDVLLGMDSLVNFVAPQDRERLRGFALRRARGEPAPSHYDYHAIKQDGSEITLACVADAALWAGEPAVQIAVIDVTVQRATIDALRQSEARFSAFFEKSPYPMCIQDPQGRYIAMNDALTNTLGIEADAIIGKLPMQALQHGDAALIDAATTRVGESRETASYEFSVTVGGEKRFISSTKFPIGDPAGELLGMGSVGNEITERKAAERQIESYQTELRQLASSAALAEERERRRIATELHDGAVQNLGLASIRLGTLLKTVGDSEHAKRLSDLGDLITTSTREMRSLMSELSPPMLYEIGLEAAITWLAKKLEEQFDLTCVVRAVDVPERLADDRTVIVYQSVRELLMNVVKHAQASSAEVELRRAGANVEIVVRDNGRGIAPDRMSLRPSDAGGFGLFNLRERLRLLEGDLEIESGSGTRVTMRIPVHS